VLTKKNVYTVTQIQELCCALGEYAPAAHAISSRVTEERGKAFHKRERKIPVLFNRLKEDPLFGLPPFSFLMPEMSIKVCKLN
jgi:hypothetical protein